MITALWPHWFRPQWLLILPLLVLLIWRLWHRQKRAGRWQMLLPTHFHAVLLNGGRGSNSKLPWLALGLAWLLALFALLGPSWQRVEQISQKPVDPLVVILELTPQMLATDTPPTRLEQARRKLLDLLQKRSDAQTAIVVYAGSAHTLVPLSDDLVTSHNLLDAIRPSIMPMNGQRADLAVHKALTLLKQGALGQGRILLLTSSLSEQERQGIREALRGQSPPLLILGIGTAEGAPVTQENGSLLKDDQGAILVPRLDSASLNDFADQVGGSYRQARGDEEDLRSLGLLASPQHVRSDGHLVQLDTWAAQGHWLLLPLLLIAALAGRRGWLFCLPLLFMFPQNSQAFEFQDLWLRPDQQGQRLLEQHRPAEAALRFDDVRWRGVALYERRTTPAPPSSLPRATARQTTTIVAMLWRAVASWKLHWMLTNRRWTASRSFLPRKPIGRWCKVCWIRPRCKSLRRTSKTRPIRAKKASKPHRTRTAAHRLPMKTRPEPTSPAPVKACRRIPAARRHPARRWTTNTPLARRLRALTARSPASGVRSWSSG